MSNPHHSVLVLDDDPNWADLIEDALDQEFNVTKITDPEKWGLYIGGTYWDAIVVDVQILDSDMTGTKIAETEIRKSRITSPVIVISGNVNLDAVKKEFGNIFFGYVSKNDYNEPLLQLARRATNTVEKTNPHTKNAERYGKDAQNI